MPTNIPTNTINNTILNSDEAKTRNLPIIGNTVSFQILKTLQFCSSKLNSDILDAAYFGKTEISYDINYIENQLGLDLGTFLAFLISRGYCVYSTDIYNRSMDASGNALDPYIGDIDDKSTMFKYGKIGYTLIDPKYIDDDGNTDVPDNRKLMPKFVYGVTDAINSDATKYYFTLQDSVQEVGAQSRSSFVSYNFGDDTENTVKISDEYKKNIKYININFNNYSNESSYSKSPMDYYLVIN